MVAARRKNNIATPTFGDQQVWKMLSRGSTQRRREDCLVSEQAPSQPTVRKQKISMNEDKKPPAGGSNKEKKSSGTNGSAPTIKEKGVEKDKKPASTPPKNDAVTGLLEKATHLLRSIRANPSVKATKISFLPGVNQRSIAGWWRDLCFAHCEVRGRI